jgi:hypothetical protein
VFKKEGVEKKDLRQEMDVRQEIVNLKAHFHVRLESSSLGMLQTSKVKR